MPVENVNFLLLCQVTTYVLAFILSLFLYVPIGIHLENFRGHCLLFSSGKWNESGHLLVTWSSTAYCSYGICVGVIIMIISCIQIYRLSVFLYKGTDSSFLSAFIDTVGSFILTVMTFIGAVFITLGFRAWCDAITTRYISCMDASANDIREKDIILPGFYLQIGTAQFAAWGAWVCAVAMTVFAVLKTCKYHQAANIAVSMAKERRRLLDESGKTMAF